MLEYYLHIYVPLVTTLGLSPILRFGNKKVNNVFALFCIIFFASIVLLLRDIEAPDDMKNYIQMYNQATTFKEAMSQYHGNLAFSFFMYLGNKLFLPWKVYFYSFSLFSFFMYAYGVKIIFRHSKKHYLFALSFFSLGSTFILLFTNVIRQGLGLAFLMLFIGCMVQGRNKLAHVYLALGVFSHFSILPIVLIVFASNYLYKKKLSFIVYFSPIAYFVGTLLLRSLSVLGGLFTKIEFLANKDYNNLLVYVKVVLLYILSLIFYFYGKKMKLFSNESFKYIFLFFELILYLIFFTLPILLVSSRFLYYATGICPVLFAFLFYNRKNILSLKYLFVLFLLLGVFYGAVVFNFPSVKVQLGILQ